MKINISGETNSIELERISLTTMRAVNTPHRGVLKDQNDDCLYVEYFSFAPGILYIYIYMYIYI